MNHFSCASLAATRAVAAVRRLAALLFLIGGFPASVLAEDSTASSLAQTGGFSRMAQGFERNEGQHPDSVKFVARRSQHQVFIESSQVTLALFQPSRTEDRSQADGLAKRQSLVRSNEAGIVRMRMVGANASAAVEGVQLLPGRFNYFVGTDPSRWRTGVSHFSRVIQREVYPGVDVEWYYKNGELEYDFLVKPNADPKRIELAVDGARDMRISEKGEVIIGTHHGSLVKRAPVVYQATAEGRKAIVGRYRSVADRHIRFELGAYDKSLPLVIDPILSYATYIGGTSGLGDNSKGIAVDGSGQAYVLGETSATDFPTVNAVQSGLGFSRSLAFVVKLDASGRNLLYGTYFGGTDSSVSAQAMGIDASGSAYLLGYGCGAIPTTSGAIAPAPACTAYAYPFVAKLAPSGAALSYSTFLSDPSILALPNALVVDVAGSAYVAGSAAANFPVTAGALQSTSAGVWVAKLNATGTGYAYSARLGEGFARGVAVDPTGNVYLTGSAGVGFPTTAGVFQPTLKPSITGQHRQAAFVAKLNPTASALVFSTFVGGGHDYIPPPASVFDPLQCNHRSNNGEDVGRAIAVDGQGNVYIAGTSFWKAGVGTPFPTTANAPRLYDTFSHSSYNPDAFVAKFSPDGTTLLYSMLIGQSGECWNGQGLAVAPDGTATVVGDTASDFHFRGFPEVDRIWYASKSGAFALRLTPDGSRIAYSISLPGDGLQEGSPPPVGGVALDAAGNAYVAGPHAQLNSGALSPSPVEGVD